MLVGDACAGLVMEGDQSHSSAAAARDEGGAAETETEGVADIGPKVGIDLTIGMGWQQVESERGSGRCRRLEHGDLEDVG